MFISSLKLFSKTCQILKTEVTSNNIEALTGAIKMIQKFSRLASSSKHNLDGRGTKSADNCFLSFFQMETIFAVKQVISALMVDEPCCVGEDQMSIPILVEYLADGSFCGCLTAGIATNAGPYSELNFEKKIQCGGFMNLMSWSIRYGRTKPMTAGFALQA